MHLLVLVGGCGEIRPLGRIRIKFGNVTNVILVRFAVVEGSPGLPAPLPGRKAEKSS